LLAYLSLQKGRECSTEQLQELFWPESDADRQAQNLRRAVSDLRNVLEEGMALGSVVVTRRNYVSLNTSLIQSDVERFLELTRLSQELDSDAMAEAVGLYGGPLLAPLDESWLLLERMELEERFAQVVVAFCGRRIEVGAVNEAIRVGRAAVSAAPLREDIHVALITAYRRADMEAEAIRQYEELERLLHEAWGETPSERARLSLMDDLATPTQSTAWDPSGGAMAPDSKFYMRRGADEQIQGLLRAGEGVVLVQGPRQVGKSSLVARALAYARSQKVSVAFTDAQALGNAQLADTEILYKTLAHGIAKQLGVEIDVAENWSDWLGANVSLDTIVGKILDQCDGKVCWAIDEADLFFDKPYTNDFFGLLRSWHNRRALDPDGPWRRLTLVLAYATEAHLFITDLNQSPFNVGVRMSLRDFSVEEVKSLQFRHGEIREAESWKTVFEITHGHPYLSQCAFAFLAQGGSSERLKDAAARQDGPFGAHLNRLLVAISQSPELLSEVKRQLQGEPFEIPTTRYRLQSAGIVSITAAGVPEFRVPIYEAYLRAEFN
jgi:DNA-binding SARP family transcriptional activator